MKVKTSVSLSEDLLRQIDERIAAPGRRSDFIENAVREHLARVARDENDAHDREIYNRLSNDAEHQVELHDVLRLQADLNGLFEVDE